MKMICAVGAAFNMNDMFMNFPYKKLKFTCETSYKLCNNTHRDVLVKMIFRECVNVVLNDVIDNNVTFWFPSVKCNIHMKSVRDNAFKNLRRSGKWLDVDLIASSFTGHEIGLFLLGNRTPRVKTIYVNRTLKDKITTNTNNGMQYGDSKYDKYIKDYYEIIHEKFPQILISDIKRILNFGWKSVYLHNSYGGDVIIKNRQFWCYMGYLKNDTLKYFHYYIKKLSIKIRILYRRNKIEWDGYYYFALTNNQYSEYIKQKNKMGRPKKYFKFINVMLYQILDECKLQESGKRYIFKIPFTDVIRFKLFYPELITDKAELLLIREPLKFKDILVSENEYEFL